MFGGIHFQRSAFLRVPASPAPEPHYSPSSFRLSRQERPLTSHLNADRAVHSLLYSRPGTTSVLASGNKPSPAPISRAHVPARGILRTRVPVRRGSPHQGVHWSEGLQPSSSYVVPVTYRYAPSSPHHVGQAESASSRSKGSCAGSRPRHPATLSIISSQADWRL